MLSAILAGCGGQDVFPPTETSVVTGGLPEGGQVEIAVDGGTAVLEARGDGRTLVRLSGLREAAVHEGACENLGEVVYRLDGEESVIAADLIDLLAGRFAIAADGACGEIISPGE